MTASQPLDWQNPRGTAHPISIRTWISGTTALLMPEPVKPPLNLDWPNPRGAPFPVANRGIISAIPIYVRAPVVLDLGYSPAPLGYPGPVVLGQAAATSWVRQVATVTNSVQAGRLNATLGIELTPNLTSTDVIDSRIAAGSLILFMPLTAAAAAELAAGTMFVGYQTRGMATITHASANNDRRFRLLLIG